MFPDVPLFPFFYPEALEESQAASQTHFLSSYHQPGTIVSYSQVLYYLIGYWQLDVFALPFYRTRSQRWLWYILQYGSRARCHAKRINGVSNLTPGNKFQRRHWQKRVENKVGNVKPFAQIHLGEVVNLHLPDSKTCYCITSPVFCREVNWEALSSPAVEWVSPSLLLSASVGMKLMGRGGIQ